MSQIDLGGDSNLNSKVYKGMSKAPSEAALKKNILQFYDCWIKYLDSQKILTQSNDDSLIHPTSNSMSSRSNIYEWSSKIYLL